MRWILINPIKQTGWGGMEGWMIRLSRGLRALGDECLVVGRADSPWSKACAGEGLPFAAIPFGGDVSPATWIALASVLKTWNPDAVIAKGFRQARWVRWVDRSIAIGVKLPAPGDLADTVIDRFTFRHAIDRILVDSLAVRAEFLRLPWTTPGRIVAIHNGVEDGGPWPDAARRARARAALGVTGEEPVVAVVGRFTEDKRLDDALDAFARGATGLPAVLAVIGDGPGRAAYEKRAARADLKGRVRFMGWRDDAAELLRGADVLLHASAEEGLSNAVLEAMAAGAAVVTTNIGGMAEAVRDGVTGYTVAIGNAGALADRLAALLADPGLCRRMGAAGAARAREGFTIAAMAGAIRGEMNAVADHRRLMRSAPRVRHGVWVVAGAADAVATARRFLDVKDDGDVRVKTTPRVRVERRPEGLGNLYGKWFLTEAPRDRWGSGFRPVRALRNLRVAHRLAALGIAVVPHRAAAWRRKGPLAVESLLVTADVPGAVPFDQWGRDHASDRRSLRVAAMSAGTWLADLHEAGVFPHDLKASNLLRDSAGRLILLDLDNCAVGRRVSVHAVVRNLAQFRRSFEQVAGLREWRTFLAAYARRRRWSRASLVRALRRLEIRLTGHGIPVCAPLTGA